jgi:hypothetical protein
MSITTKEAGFCEVSPRQDIYQHMEATVDVDPLLVDRALKVHTEGYLSMNFVGPDAVGSDGYLVEGVDKSRRPNTLYYLALNPNQAEDAATMRKVSLSTGETYTNLPTFDTCSQSLTREGMRLLEETPVSQLKEIAGLARTRAADPSSVYEIIRNAIHRAVGHNEIWFFGIVSTTYESLVKRLGTKNLQVIGEDVPINDSRVNPDIKLRPTIVRPDEFVLNIFREYVESSEYREKVRFLKTFQYFSEGLDVGNMLGVKPLRP